jgi:hypothetical protein
LESQNAFTLQAYRRCEEDPVTITLEDFRGDVRRAPRRGRRTPTPEPDDLQRGDRVQRRARPLLVEFETASATRLQATLHGHTELREYLEQAADESHITRAAPARHSFGP